ncbi:MAG: type restriction endonuclease subunit [Schlesneria sp.]|nr:type restriction endonuclease subunit [Schlesneria sp.]
MLAFARNERPDDDSQFWFVSPQADFSLNRLGELRIDAHAAHVLSVGELIQESWLLKCLAIGSWLDVEVVRKIRSCKSRPLIEYWEGDLGLASTQGYKVKGEPNDASSLHVLLDLGAPKRPSSPFTVDPTAYELFSHETLDRTRLDEKSQDQLRAYRAPLFLLKKSLPPDRKLANSLTSYVDIAFNQSYYGYSACGDEDAELLVRYLHVFAHGSLWTYLLLATSPTIGTERPVFLKSDFDSCALIPLNELSEIAKSQLFQLSKRLESADISSFDDIDRYIASLFGLSKRDVEVMSDTGDVRNPHDELGICGSRPTTEQEIQHFCSEVRAAIRPFAKKVGFEVNVEQCGDQTKEDAFRFLRISVIDFIDQSVDDVRHLILQLADRIGASLIIQANDGVLFVGVLNQYRYWTKSRARLLAADILRDHFSTFERWQSS